MLKYKRVIVPNESGHDSLAFSRVRTPTSGEVLARPKMLDSKHKIYHPFEQVSPNLSRFALNS